MSRFSDELCRLMDARGRRVRELAREIPCNPGHLSNLRHDRRRPSLDVAIRLDELLDAGGRLTALASGEGASSGNVASPVLLDELVNRAVEFGRWAEATNLGAGTIEQLDDAVHRVAREYAGSAPEPLIRRAGEISHHVLGLLQQHQRLRQTRDLYVIGSKASAFLASACGDLGQQDAAAAHGRTALILAQEAGHPGAVALALSSLSKVAFWDRQRKRAGELARRGYECCPANSTRVLLACQEADAADVPAAREAIRRAVEAYEDMMADDDLPGLFSCGRVRRACYTMTLHLRADEPSRVLDAAAEADAAYAEGEEVHYATWAQVQISAAIAYLRGGEVEGAAYRLAPVLALPPEMRLATFDGKLAYIAAALAALRYRGDGVAGGLTEQVRAYLRQRQMDTLPYPMALGAGIGAGR